MVLTFDYVWGRIFKDLPDFSSEYYDNENEDLVDLCMNIATARNQDLINKNQTANLIRAIRRDIINEEKAWLDLLSPDNFGVFIKCVEDYQQIRGTFKSRNKEPVEAICFPLSNEILFGKGLNSNIRDKYQ